MTAERFSDQMLDAMRKRGDPVADAVVNQVFEDGSLDAVNDLLIHIVRNAEPIPEELPEVVQDYLRETAALPEWADPRLVKVGEDLFLDAGPLCLLSLISVSLPVAYSMSRAVPVLASTQQLEEHTTRRILETAQFIVDVMATGGLARGGSGVRAAQRVRLLHASIRHLLLTEGEPRQSPRHFGDVLTSTPWPAEAGMPICQEDMGGTILTFSWLVIRSLRRLHQEVSDEQAQAYYHCWRVVGHVMGVEVELLPERWEEGRELFRRMQARQIGETQAGRELTSSLLRTTEQLFEHRVSGFIRPRQHLPRLFAHMLNEAQTLRVIGIPPLTLLERFIALPFLYFLFDLMWFFGRLAGSNRFLHSILEELAQVLVKNLTEMSRSDTRGLFAMPPHLLERWTSLPDG